jgi:cytochrome P450
MVAAHAEPQTVPSPRPKRFEDLPQLKGTFIGGNLKTFAADPLATIIDAFGNHGDLVRLRMGPIRYLLVSHPEAVHHILTENQRNYRKDTKGYKTMKKILGEGLLTSNGDFWLKQRRTAQPAFHRERIQGFADVMVRCTEEMVDEWHKTIDRGAPIDVHREMMRITLRIIGLTMMSVDLAHEATEIGEAVTTVIVRTDELITSLPGADRWPSGNNRRFHRARAKLARYLNGIISTRRQQLVAGDDVPGDLLTMLLQAEDPETGEGMNDQQLFDEMMTIFLAGHETTANALAWTFRLLAQHPEHYTTLESEIDAAGAGPFTMKDLGNLPYTKQVIQESMRLYPPAWMIGRNSVEDDALLGVPVPGGTNHFISPWLLHRHPRYWEAPSAFRPERFEGDPTQPGAGAGKKRVPKGLYIPFIEGPRQCIGKAFAMMEAQLLLANIVRRVHVSMPEDRRIEAEPVITLRPKGGLPMTITSRERRAAAA